MPSAKSKIFNMMMRNRHLFQGKLKKEVFNDNTSIDKANNPFISPLFGDLSGLPPIFINSGEDDELFDDGEKFYLKAKEAGVDIIFRSGEGMVHCYPLLVPMFNEATEAMNEICNFVNKHVGEKVLI